MTEFLRDGERLDDLQLNGLYVIQNPIRFCFGDDAVLLANFAAVKKNETVLDLCAGCGVIPILLSSKTEGGFFTGLELQPDIAEMARRSILMNNLQEKIRIDTGDLKQAPGIYGPGAFDVITVNPPYMAGGKRNENASVALARHEITCTLSDVISVSAALLKKGGRFYMVHKPDRLADIFCEMRKYKSEPKTLKAVRPAEGKPPSLALVEGVKGGKAGLKFF